MVLENKYLKKAIEKAGFVVIVKTCKLNERKSTLEYISPNASTFGMNVELLNKGLKLTEDYIHPEDRAKVISTVLEAVKSKVSEYVHEYRMVGDDGTVYKVSNEICVSEVTSEEFRVEFYLKNITGKKNKNEKKKNKKNSDIEKSKSINLGDFDEISDKVQDIMNVVSKLTKLYSVYVDMDGKMVFPPVGPATNMGDFYDLFETPAYKEYYNYIKQEVIDNNGPMVLDREEGGIGKISVAPFRIKGEIRGIWILGSYTQEETDMLKKFSEDHWNIAEYISTFVYKSLIADVEMAKAKGAGKKLREELAKQNIINTALSKINSKLIDDIDTVISETIRDVGIHMNVDKILLYKFDRDNAGIQCELRNYWNVTSAAPEGDVLDDLSSKMYHVEEGIKTDGKYIVDNSNMTEKSKINLMKFNFMAVIAHPIYMNDKLYGALFFAESKNDRVWTKEEIRFTEGISIIIQNMLENAEGDDNIRKVNKHLIETYNNFKVGVFIRDAYSGEVLFSNAKMNEMLGYDFKGGDSRVILTDLRDRYDNITGMRKPFITKEKVVNWRSYIQRLDDIMDITEVQIEWLKGEPASLIILRKAKDL